jgi:thymidylate synthase (FAD)
MKIIEPSVKFLASTQYAFELIENAGRTCYKSEVKSKESSEKFVKKIIDNGHDSVLEHAHISLKIICDRGVSHEMVRHRIASFSQESTRYCNYSKDKFGGEITVIKPLFFHPSDVCYIHWYKAMETAEKAYFDLLLNGATAQEARSVLPNSLKTELVMTANIREWRHILKLRCSEYAHPQMQEVAKIIKQELIKNTNITLWEGM